MVGPRELLSLSLKTAAAMEEGCTWSAAFGTSEQKKSRTLGCFTEGAFWWRKEAEQCG